MQLLCIRSLSEWRKLESLPKTGPLAVLDLLITIAIELLIGSSYCSGSVTLVTGNCRSTRVITTAMLHNCLSIRDSDVIIATMALRIDGLSNMADEATLRWRAV